jgi:hypothetical protein
MQRIQLSITLIIALALVGCNQAPQLKGLVPASGTVTFNGEPVEGAMVIFIPDSEGTSMRAASATTGGANGRFTLMTLQPADGAFPGTYKVTVEKTETTENDQTVRMGPDGRAMDNLMTVDFLPLKYMDISTSDLTVEIPPRGNRNITLELSGEVDTTPRRPDARTRR